MQTLTLGHLKKLQQEHNLPDSTVVLVPDFDHSYRGGTVSVQPCFHLGGDKFDPWIPNLVRVGRNGKNMEPVPALIIGE